MAEFGFSVNANDGYVQVDSQYANYALLDKGNAIPPLVTKSTACMSYDVYELDITFPITLTRPPIILAHSTGPVHLSALIDSASGYTGAKLWGNGSRIYYALYVPDSEIAAASDWGLEVYGPDSTRVFTSDHSYLLVRDVITLSKGFRGNFNHASVTRPYYSMGTVVGVNSEYRYDNLALNNVDANTGNLDWHGIYNGLASAGCLWPNNVAESDTHYVLVCEVN